MWTSWSCVVAVIITGIPGWYGLMTGWQMINSWEIFVCSFRLRWRLYRRYATLSGLNFMRLHLTFRGSVIGINIFNPTKSKILNDKWWNVNYERIEANHFNMLAKNTDSSSQYYLLISRKVFAESEWSGIDETTHTSNLLCIFPQKLWQKLEKKS